jgi:hypothetical protein
MYDYVYDYAGESRASIFLPIEPRIYHLISSYANKGIQMWLKRTYPIAFISKQPHSYLHPINFKKIITMRSAVFFALLLYILNVHPAASRGMSWMTCVISINKN